MAVLREMQRVCKRPGAASGNTTSHRGKRPGTASSSENKTGQGTGEGGAGGGGGRLFLLEHGLGQVNTARHVNQHDSNPRMLTQTASYDVASNIWQALCTGGARRTGTAFPTPSNHSTETQGDCVSRH